MSCVHLALVLPPHPQAGISRNDAPIPIVTVHIVIQTIATLDKAKVSQIPGHTAVHEPVLSDVQVPQYVSIFTLLVQGILRTFL